MTHEANNPHRTTPASGNGRDAGGHGVAVDTTGDAALDRFAADLRTGLPRLSGDAMSRVEAIMRRELDAVYSSVKSEQPVAATETRPAVLFSFRPIASMAAMLALVIGLSLHVSSPTRVSPPTDPRLADATPAVVEEFRVFIEPDTGIVASRSPLDAVFVALDRYESLIGLDRFTRR